ncbi:MAG: hypothetical protein GYB64_16680 [Chloroflexi bacterium]|nr:hypothetical protein [Chloroflexota bacterium]
MNAGNIIFIALVIGASLLMFMRTERKFKWATGLFLVVPAIGLVAIWADGLNRWGEALAGGGIGLGFNVLFWLVYGRTHPPGTSDSITVVGMEE